MNKIAEAEKNHKKIIFIKEPIELGLALKQLFNLDLVISQSQTRIFIKSLLYRIIAFSLTFIVSYIATRNVKKSLQIGVFVEFIQFVIYYFYEHIWNQVNWGMNFYITD